MQAEKQSWRLNFASSFSKVPLPGCPSFPTSHSLATDTDTVVISDLQGGMSQSGAGKTHQSLLSIPQCTVLQKKLLPGLCPRPHGPSPRPSAQAPSHPLVLTRAEKSCENEEHGDPLSCSQQPGFSSKTRKEMRGVAGIRGRAERRGGNLCHWLAYHPIGIGYGQNNGISSFLTLMTFLFEGLTTYRPLALS